MRKPRWFRIGLGACALAVAAVLLAPTLSADRFHSALRGLLEEALESPVEVGEVRFSLWGGPGFRLRNVVIADAAEVSAEPFAYVSEVHLRLGLATLWKGSMVVSRITLVQPSLNIARGPDGEWNYGRLVHRGVGGGTGSGRVFPEVLVTSGRINFRDGLRKSVYYFRNADLRIADEGIGGDARLLEFRAEPARTDSYAPRFGTIHGYGRWRPAAGPNGEIDIDVGIEQSPVAELAALLGVPRAGLSGYARASAHLSGPAERLSLRGSVELREQSDWLAFLGRRDGRGVAIEGEVNLPGRRLTVHTSPGLKQDGSQPFQASFEVFPPDAPDGWQCSFQFEDVPAEDMHEILQQVDDTLPRYPELRGALTGQIDYRRQTGLRGSLRSRELAWQPEDAPSRFLLRDLDLRIEGDLFSGAGVILLPPLPAPGTDAGGAEPPPGDPASGAQLEFQVNRASGQQALRLSGNAIERGHLAALELLATDIDHGAPLLSGTGWTGKGALHWQRPAYRTRGAWQGSLQIRSLVHPVDGFRTPVNLESALLDLRGAVWHLRQMRGSLGRIAFQGEMSHQPGAARPYQLTLRTEVLDLAALDTALRLDSEDARGFFRRTFSRRQRANPAWLRQRALIAKIHSKSVLIEEYKYSDMKGDLYWDGEDLEIRNISFRSRFGLFHGIAAAEFSEGGPVWTCHLAGEHEAWEGGTLQMALNRSARGGLGALFGNASGETEVRWEREPGEQEGGATSVRARLLWRAGGAGPEICDDCVELRNEDGVWLGSCNQSNGTGYRCQMEDPQTSQRMEMELPISMVGTAPN